MGAQLGSLICGELPPERALRATGEVKHHVDVKVNHHHKQPPRATNTTDRLRVVGMDQHQHHNTTNNITTASHLHHPPSPASPASPASPVSPASPTFKIKLHDHDVSSFTEEHQQALLDAVRARSCVSLSPGHDNQLERARAPPHQATHTNTRIHHYPPPAPSPRRRGRACRDPRDQLGQRRRGVPRRARRHVIPRPPSS